ncbi:DUF370 domain-containing protein, partial [Dysosmobacter welbionis]
RPTAGGLRPVCLAEDDAGPAKEAFVPLHVHRHELRPGTDADDGHTTLGGQSPLVFHPGSLREYQQVVPALDSLQGGFHRLDVPLAPVN